MSKYIIPATIFVIPLLFLTNTSNFFATPKQIFLIAAVLILLVIQAIQNFTKRSLSVSTSTLRFGLLAFVISILINLLANPVGRLEALVGPGSLYLALSLWTYLLTQETGHKIKDAILATIIASSSILSLHTLAQLTFLYKLTVLPTFMQSRAFTMTGSPLVTFILIFLGAAVSLYLTLASSRSKTLLIFSTTLHTIALIALGALLLPNQELAINLLPLGASWNVALDSMKTTRTLLLGIGLPNFPIFYNTVKPLFLNSTSFWNSLPATASSEVMQIMTTMGLLGILSFISLPLIAFKSVVTKDTSTIALKLLASLSLLSLLVTPGSIPVLLIFFSTLGLLSSSEPSTRTLPAPSHIIVSLITLAIVGTIGFFTSRVVLAENNIRGAQLAISQNDGKTLYEKTLKAVEILPNMTSYRLAYSQVNLSLATSLSQKESLTDAERENVTTLVSQAVREGKAAINLSPNNGQTWQNLGGIYQKLINVGDNADQFAVEAYTQAVKLDPANPTLRVEFGGLLYQLAQNSKVQADQTGLYGRAQSEFQTAIQLKPDFPNAYYNLAKLLESVKDYGNSASVMQKAISLLGPDNPELSRANTELEAIKAKMPKATPTPSPKASPKEVTQPVESDLSAPSPLPSPLDGGPIEIPTN